MSHPTVSETPTTEREPRILAAVELPGDIRQLQIAMLQGLVRQLQADLAVWQPLENAYQAEMAGRARRGFRVEPRDVWARDLARKLAGVQVEDAGSVNDSLADREDA